MNKKNPKMSDASIDPIERLKKLNKKASDFECDDKIPVIRYLRSTKEMERMVRFIILLHLIFFIHYFPNGRSNVLIH